MDFEKLYEESYAKATPSERARMDKAEEDRRVELARPRIDVAAIRTDCFSGQERQVTVTLLVKTGNDGCHYVFIDRGGPTGYESAQYDRLYREGEESGWNACSGTKGRWDRLVVPRSSLRIAYAFFEPLRKDGKLT
jgi:hypothetical protein